MSAGNLKVLFNAVLIMVYWVMFKGVWSSSTSKHLLPMINCRRQSHETLCTQQLQIRNIQRQDVRHDWNKWLEENNEGRSKTLNCEPVFYPNPDRQQHSALNYWCNNREDCIAEGCPSKINPFITPKADFFLLRKSLQV